MNRIFRGGAMRRHELKMLSAEFVGTLAGLACFFALGLAASGRLAAFLHWCALCWRAV